VFDTDVLLLPWSRLFAGQRPKREEMVEAALRNIDTAALRDWYSPEVGVAPLSLGRLMCQRTNGIWDAKQRKYYRVVLLIVITILAIALVACHCRPDGHARIRVSGPGSGCQS
jgi:hypothetical protein